ncbi:MAG: hypothetical protein JWQ07_87 [Ramlibacter sp.]|nr:hypothetical protein [Ramlibacter sp.]
MFSVRLLTWALGACVFVSSEARAEPPTPVTIQAGNAVRIELIAQPRELELPSRFHLALRLINSTDGTVIFHNFKLTPLEEPGGLQVSPECEDQKQAFIGARSTFTITCEVFSRYFDDSIPKFPQALFGSWSLLTLQPGEYRFVATAQVRQEDNSLLATSETVPVRIRPTVWQVCAGAALGAFFLVVFTFSSVKARGAFLNNQRIESMKGWRLWGVEPLLLWLGATVAASIFIFLTYRLKDVSSPITITVNDFYGGMVFGLFGVFIADHLASRFYARVPTMDDTLSTAERVPPASNGVGPGG